MSNIKLYGVAVLMLISSTLIAQRLHTVNNDLWLQYNGDHKISKKIGLHLEYQERRSSFGSSNQQHLFRTGINYHFLPNAFASAGYAYVYTYPYGDFAVKSTFPEHRIYEQLQYSTNLSKVEAITRFRLEQRLSNLPTMQADSSFAAASQSTYTNRFRYFQRLSLPFKGSKIIDGSFYGTFYNEFFINFGKHVGKNIFDQNRAFAGMGYKVPKLGKVELGYMNQIIFKADGIKVENNNTIVAALNANFDWKRGVKK